MTESIRSSKESVGQKIGQMTFVLLFAFVCWFPRIGGHLRFEDLLTPVIFCAALLLLTKKTLRVSKLPLLAVIFTVIVTTIAVTVGFLPLDAFLILGKEVQAFLIYLLGLEVLRGKFLKSNSLGLFLWLITTVAASYAILTFLTEGGGGWYGLGYINEPDSPSLSALMYFNLFILSIIVLLANERRNWRFKWILPVPSLILIVATLLVGSRTAVVAVVVFVGSYVLMLDRTRRWAFAVFVLLAIAVGGWLTVNVRFDQVFDYLYNFESENVALVGAISRASTLLKLTETLEGARYSSWDIIFSSFLDSNVLTMMFGCGRGCTHLDGSEFSVGLGGDNQYTVNLVELGLVGFILFIAAIVSAYPYVGRRWKTLYIAYMLAYLAWGMTGEVWQLSKGGQMFWFVNALLVGLSATDALAARASRLREPLDVR